MFTKEKRSEIMRKIRSKGTRIEMLLKEELDRQKIEYEYQPKLFGKPDFLVLPNLVIFCDSSFWHGRDWNKLEGKLSSEYWRKHIKQNVDRDKLVNCQLSGMNFVVMRFWDFELIKSITDCVSKIKNARLAEISKRCNPSKSM
jgi:DNA mismatch endonuclease, patch repair protein